MTDAEIEDRFSGCSPATLDAIRTYRRAHDPALVTPILNGIIRQYLPEAAPALEPDETLNAFGLESLTLMELILDLQDALGITLLDEELKRLRNIDDAGKLIAEKVNALRS